MMLASLTTPLPASTQQLLNIGEPSPEFMDFAWGTPRDRIALLKVDREFEGRLYVRGRLSGKKTVSVYDFDEEGLYRRKIIVATQLDPYVASRHTKTFEKWRLTLTQSFGKPTAGFCTQGAIVYDDALEKRLAKGRLHLTCDWVREDTVVSLRSARYDGYLRTLVTFQDTRSTQAASADAIVGEPGTPANTIDIDEFARSADVFAASMMSHITSFVSLRLLLSL
ncbi:MAG: hypothetical protein IT350_21230 [Deltaproteobacteria bacterium]|nr:hypothetical protein [Deltaproteobacteria bacterium]